MSPIVEASPGSLAYLTHANLRSINDSSIKARRNQNLMFDNLPITNDGTLYPVSMAFVHNDVEIRATVVLNYDGDTALLDMSMEEYNALPRFYRPASPPK